MSSTRDVPSTKQHNRQKNGTSPDASAALVPSRTSHNTAPGTAHTRHAGGSRESGVDPQRKRTASRVSKSEERLRGSRLSMQEHDDSLCDEITQRTVSHLSNSNISQSRLTTGTNCTGRIQAQAEDAGHIEIEDRIGPFPECHYTERTFSGDYFDFKTRQVIHFDTSTGEIGPANTSATQ